MTTRQTAIEFDNPAGQRKRQQKRADDRRQVEQLQIPTPPATWRKKRPSAAACKAVLLALDNAQRTGESWRIKAETLAERLGYRDRGTVQRALAWLRELGLLEHVRTGRSSLFSIDRQAVAQAVADGGASLNADVGASPIRCGRGPHQMGAHPPSTLEDTQQDNSSSSSQEVLQALEAAGVFAGLAEQLAQHPAAAAILEHWTANRPAWGVGALVARLRDPSTAAGERWPPRQPQPEDARQVDATRDYEARRGPMERRFRQAHGRASNNDRELWQWAAEAAAPT